MPDNDNKKKGRKKKDPAQPIIPKQETPKEPTYKPEGYTLFSKEIYSKEPLNKAMNHNYSNMEQVEALLQQITARMKHNKLKQQGKIPSLPMPTTDKQFPNLTAEQQTHIVQEISNSVLNTMVSLNALLQLLLLKGVISETEITLMTEVNKQTLENNFKRQQELKRQQEEDNKKKDNPPFPGNDKIF